MTSAPIASVWTDVGVPLIIAFFAAAIAAFWPWLQSLQRGWKFQRIIRRELEEVGPHPVKPVSGQLQPWWEHATKRFVHQEIFQRDRVSENRDFLLSLDPTVVYQVSQLWSALETRNGEQWMWYLDELVDNPKVGSDDLGTARDQWKTIMDEQLEAWLEPMGTPTAFRKEAALGRTQPLFEKRFEAYARLLPLTDYGPEHDPKQLDRRARSRLAARLSSWFYNDGAGLLLSGRAFRQLQIVRTKLASADATDAELREEFTKLRTDLKIDLGVRQPRERQVSMAWPEEERW